MTEQLATYRGIESEVRSFVDRQHIDAYRLIEAVRSSRTGLYSDAYDTFSGGPVRMASIAATGVGLVSLAVAHREGWDPNAGEKAIQTLESALAGAAPRDEATGFFYHFHDMETGAVWGESEVSTIDTSILAAGARLAAFHFKSSCPKVCELTERLISSIDWPAAVADPDRGDIYMTIEGGKGARPIGPFNEYAIVSALAYLAAPDAPRVQALWQNVYAPDRIDALPTRAYRGVRVPVDSPPGGTWLSSFVCQFPLYLIPEYAGSADYRRLVAGACLADRLSWSAEGLGPSYIWGYGAGSNEGLPDPGARGYRVDAIGRSSGTASAYIIAGFLPVYPAGIYDLYAWYRLHLPYDTYIDPDDPDDETGLLTAYRFGLGRLHWAHGRPPNRWHPRQVTVIDWSSMLYGLTAYKRGMSFFRLTEGVAYEQE